MNEIEKELERVVDIELQLVQIQYYNSRGIFKRNKEWSAFIRLQAVDRNKNHLVYHADGGTALESIKNVVDILEYNRRIINETFVNASNTV